MTRHDVDAFIEIMNMALGEKWTPEEVEEKYGDCRTLKEAIDRRNNVLQAAVDDLEEMVMNDLKVMGRYQP